MLDKSLTQFKPYYSGHQIIRELITYINALIEETKTNNEQKVRYG